MDQPRDLTQTLTQHGQSHLLRHLATLPEGPRAMLAARLAEVDWAELAHPAAPPAAGAVAASRVVTLEERRGRQAALHEAGEARYRAGEVAVLMVAGGQGTRLGTKAPKGCFPLMPYSHKSIYQVQAEKLLSLSRRLGRAVPFLIMTSPATHEETAAFFRAEGNFGLEEAQLRFFCQGTVPSVDLEGRALLAGPAELLENPDGHGGCFTALVRSGNLARLQDEGVRYIVYVQVDNILAPFDDTVLLGLAAQERADVITKVLEKAHPDERVGHLVRVGDRDRIVEYTELGPEDTRRRGDDGQLLYRWGSPALHCFSVDFLGRLAARGYQLPLHRSKKPLRAWQGDGAVEVSGFKSERFIFDLLPEAAVSIGLEIARQDEFAPVKNATGDDSPETAIALASELYARWLRAAGVRVELPAEERIELSPLFGATEEQVRRRVARSAPHAVSEGGYIE